MILMEFLFAPTVPSPPTPELALDGALGRGVGALVLRQGGVGHIVHDADGELALGLGLLQLLIDREHALGPGCPWSPGRTGRR